VLSVRPFAPPDLPHVAGIVRESLRENYPTSLYIDIHRWWRDGFLVAENGASVLGFLAAVVNAPGTARVLMLAVREPYRRQGIGSRLMDSFIGECGMRGLQNLELEVRKSNVAAIRFYARYGFQISNLIPRFYTDGEDGFKMRRHL